jgi:uncharacterized protein YndB with AHSA1/START domain
MKKDEATGKRWVEVETEVPGTPDEVWAAIATGEGISSWFVPTKIEGDQITSTFGPGMDSVATVTAWDPPHRFAATSDGLGPGSPPMATEWTVEARAGGTCIVRVVHSLFASNDDWDGQLSGVESGWPSIFHVLRLYLARFKGQPPASFQAMAMVTAKSVAEAWPRFTETLAAPQQEGAAWTTPAGAPPLTGRVEWAEAGKNAQLMVVEGTPPGMVMLTSCGAGDQVMLFMGFFLFGDGAKESAERAAPAWQAWLQERFA